MKPPADHLEPVYIEPTTEGRIKMLLIAVGLAAAMKATLARLRVQLVSLSASSLTMALALAAILAVLAGLCDR